MNKTATNSFENLLKCPICALKYNDSSRAPVLLACSKTVCASCITQFTFFSNELFKCSLCQHEHTVAEDGLEIDEKLMSYLKPDFQISNLEMSQKIEETFKLFENNLFLIDNLIESQKKDLVNDYDNLLDDIELRTAQLIMQVNDGRQTLMEKVNSHKQNVLKSVEKNKIISDRNDCKVTYEKLKKQFAQNGAKDELKSAEIIKNLNTLNEKCLGLQNPLNLKKSFSNLEKIEFNRSKKQIEPSQIGQIIYASSPNLNKLPNVRVSKTQQKPIAVKNLSLTKTAPQPKQIAKKELLDPIDASKLFRIRITQEPGLITKAIWPLSRDKIFYIVETEEEYLLMRIIDSEGVILHQKYLFINVNPQNLENSLQSEESFINPNTPSRPESGSISLHSKENSYLDDDSNDYDINCLTYESFAYRTILLLQKRSNKQYSIQMYDNRDLTLIKSRLLMQKLYPSYMNDREILCHSLIEPHVRVLNYNLEEIGSFGLINRAPFNLKNSDFVIYGSNYDYAYIGYMSDGNFEIYNRNTGRHLKSVKPFKNNNWLCKLDFYSRLICVDTDRFYIRMFDAEGNELYHNAIKNMKSFSFFRLTTDNEIAFIDYESNSIIFMQNF